MNKSLAYLNSYKIANLFFYFFPLLMLCGPAVINISLLIILIFFIFNLKKIFLNLNNFFFILFIFWIYISLLSFFSDNIFLSLKTSFSQIKFYAILIFLYLFLDLKNYKIQNTALFYWSPVILFVCFDTNFQNLNGLDIFGYNAEGYYYDVGKLFLSNEKIQELNKIPVSLATDRLSGPFGSELIVGAYLAKTSPFLFYYIVKNYKKIYFKKKVFCLLLLLLILQTVFISGERTSFIIICVLSLFTIISIYKKNLFKIFLIIIIVIPGLYLNSSEFEKKRYQELFHITKNNNESSYGRLARSSIEIFKQNYIFGVGIKGFRLECPKIKDTKKENPHPPCSSHPHNGPLELLSEIGITGTLIFIIFLFFILRKVYMDFKLKRSNHLFIISSNLIFLIIPCFYLLPILPNGSFFTSWNGTFFWFSLGLMLSLTKKKLI